MQVHEDTLRCHPKKPRVARDDRSAARTARRVVVSLAATLAAACGAVGGIQTLEPPRQDPDLVQRGGFLFLDPRISGDGRTSCASCHTPQAGGRGVYAGVERVAPGTSEGRVAPLLRGLYLTGPYLWDGSESSVAGVIDRMLAIHMKGGSLEPADKRALEAYLLSIPVFDNARIAFDGAPTEPATKLSKDGFAAFQKAECGACHPAPTFAGGSLNRSAGTGDRYNVPTLRGLPKEGPFGHDGRWATLEDSVIAMLAAREVELSNRERVALIEYLKIF
jgi:cytochrome c peroxidase